MIAPDRRARLDRDHGQLSIRPQRALLGVARSGVYRPARPVDEAGKAAPGRKQNWRRCDAER